MEHWKLGAAHQSRELHSPEQFDPIAREWETSISRESGMWSEVARSVRPTNDLPTSEGYATGVSDTTASRKRGVSAAKNDLAAFAHDEVKTAVGYPSRNAIGFSSPSQRAGHCPGSVVTQIHECGDSASGGHCAAPATASRR